MSYVLISFYDDKEAINTPKIPSELVKHIVAGLNEVCKRVGILVKDIALRKAGVTIGIDGYIGVEWKVLISKFKESLKELQLDFELLDVADLYKPSDYIEDVVRPFLACDPHFGRIFEGEIEMFLRGEELKERIEQGRKNSKVLVCFGCGAVNRFTADLYLSLIHISEPTRPY